MQHLKTSLCPPQVFTGTCGWSMSSRANCRALRPSSLTALETAVASSRSRASGRNTTWEPRWQEPVTRQSGTTMSPNCTSSWPENKLKTRRLNSRTLSTRNSHGGCWSGGNSQSARRQETPTVTKHLLSVPLFPPPIVA